MAATQRRARPPVDRARLRALRAASRSVRKAAAKTAAAKRLAWGKARAKGYGKHDNARWFNWHADQLGGRCAIAFGRHLERHLDEVIETVLRNAGNVAEADYLRLHRLRDLARADRADGDLFVSMDRALRDPEDDRWIPAIALTARREGLGLRVLKEIARFMPSSVRWKVREARKRAKAYGFELPVMAADAVAKTGGAA